MKAGEPREICILSQFWLPDVVGDSVRLRQLVTALQELGWRVTLITTKPHYPDGDDKGFKFRFTQVRWEDGMKVVRIAMPRLRYAGFINRMIMYAWFTFFASIYAPLMSNGPVIWAFSMKVFSTYAAIPARELRGSKLVSEATDIWPEALVNTGYIADGSKTSSLVRRMAAIAYHASDVVSTITPVMASKIASEFGLDERKVMVNPYIGREHVQRPTSDSPVFTVLYFGNLGANYDIPFIIEVAEKLRHEGVRVVIRGDGERLAEVKEAVRERSLANVELIDRVLDERELTELEDSSDALILPMVRARYENASFPGKLVDYLFAGKPIIYVGGGLPARIIREHDAGLAVATPDIEVVASFILTLKVDVAMSTRMGENARKLAHDDFTSASLKDSVAALLKRVVPD